MLKYQINVNELVTDKYPIVLSDFESSQLEGEEYRDKFLLNCYCDDELLFNENNRIFVSSTQYVNNDDLATVSEYVFDYYTNMSGFNAENRSFSLLYDKYFNLNVEDMEIVETDMEESDDDTDNENVTNGDNAPIPLEKWVYIYFKEPHFYNMTTMDVYRLYIYYDGGTMHGSDDPAIFYVANHYGMKKEVGGEEWIADAEILTKDTIRIKKSDFHKKFDSTPNEIEDDSDSDEEEKPSELESLLFGADGKIKPTNFLMNVHFYRDEFIFSSGNFSLYADKPTTSVVIPISQRFETDLLKDEAINNGFVQSEMKKAVNSIVEMEKDVYYPVIKTVDETNDVYHIKFNLHFRKRDSMRWVVTSNDSFWNGVEYKNVNREEETPLYKYVLTDNGFFNSAYLKDTMNYEQNQPDLLKYMGFNDKDVNYQKNKLRKSFLRVMFYDSTNTANQNLLAYYTVFYDSGNAFSKFARNVETKGYYEIDDEGNKKENLTGLRVDREPTIDENGDDVTIDTVENVRIGSQFVISDKYISDSSSEGFYLYLWKDNFMGVVPQDIYMKVEFNHAGYGRTIPFMMPYWDEDKWNGSGDNRKTGIKTFQEILNDWNSETGSDGPYGIREYLKYSYIHFKYCYDKATKRHIYYLDNEIYGDSVNFADNTITLNLYEAKMV